MKNAVYRPADYRRNTLTPNTSAQDELMKSFRQKAEFGSKDPYTSNRPWLK